MKKLLLLLLILIVLLSCGRGGKALDSVPSRIVPDSFAIGLNLFNKARTASHNSACYLSFRHLNDDTMSRLRQGIICMYIQVLNENK